MVDILFSVLNFSIVIGIFAFLASRHIVPQVKQRVSQEKQVIEDLHDDHKQLLVAEKHVEENIREQELSFAYLSKQLQLWNEAVKTQEKAAQAEKRYRAEQFEKKLERQAQQYAINSLFIQLRPRVLSKLETEFAQKFSDDRQGHAYIEDILRKLKA
jgi:hypothetical protein